MELFDAIMTRRSIRRYKSDPVDDKKIEKILEAGRWAPSWSNTQCWRFVVVRAPEIKAKLADTLLKFKLPDKEIPNPAINIINTVPILIVVCAEMGKSGDLPAPVVAAALLSPIRATGLCSIRPWRCRIWCWPHMPRGWAR